MAHQKEKKKFNQNDLRRLMKERKENLASEKSIESPLAKYDSTGRLSCIACNEIIKSSALWRVHILGKVHKKNITEKLKRKTTEETDPILLTSKKVKTNDFSKISSTYSNTSVDQKQEGQIKRLENSTSSKSSKVNLIQEYSSSDNDEEENVSLESKTPVEVSSVLPSDFFDSSTKATTNSSASEAPSTSNSTSLSSKNKSNQETIPEGFFDDPVLDAHARNVVYKDPLDEEMEKFQKAIAEETNLSQNMMDVDIEQSVAERNIEQIDEQMCYYGRVVAVQKKSEEVKESKSNKSDIEHDNVPMDVSSKSSESEDEERLLEELSDWRAKKIC